MKTMSGRNRVIDFPLRLEIVPLLPISSAEKPLDEKILVQRQLLEIDDQQLFVLAEHWHNIRSVPRATMKVLKYLHENANVRILAIEQGQSWNPL